jgi:hypothetical protein
MTLEEAETLAKDVALQPMNFLNDACGSLALTLSYAPA